MTPSLSGRIPQYALIAQQLLEDISRGRYPDDSLLPAEPELCRMFGVSRVTVRGAMRELELRGVCAAPHCATVSCMRAARSRTSSISPRT